MCGLRRPGKYEFENETAAAPVGKRYVNFAILVSRFAVRSVARRVAPGASMNLSSAKK